MTDNEIIKALECCSYATTNRDCEKCSYYPDEDCTKKQCADIINLINRQKAEIERLRVDLKYYLDNNEESGVVYIPKFIVEKRIKELSEVSDNENN